ncbi:30S ribosomal protein S16 [Candidatus Saccharibacteria bacterium]|nr:30S ribosomal protein S16 [Candidatus Saccharibacteria bacterium]
MLAIRLQRTGRSGHAQFRMIVQDSRFSPTRGRVVAYLGSYDPHTKTATLDSQKAAQYLENGAQPSDRAARLLQKEGVKLPDWVKISDPKERTVRNPEKRRSTRPAEPEAATAEPEAAAEPTEAAAEPEPVVEEPAVEASAEEAAAEAETETTEAADPAAEETTEPETPAEEKSAEPDAQK